MTDYKNKYGVILQETKIQVNLTADDSYVDALTNLTPLINNLWFSNLKMKSMLIFHPYAPNGEVITHKDGLPHSGGKTMPNHYISDCYGFSSDGEWFKLRPPPSNQYQHKGLHSWSKINQVHKLNKEMVVRAMLLQGSF